MSRLGMSRLASCLVLVLLAAATSSSSLALQWHAGMDPAALGGTFHDTCVDCRVDANGYLICRCFDPDQRLKPTSLRVMYCQSGPNNGSGQLLCDPPIRGSWAGLATPPA